MGRIVLVPTISGMNKARGGEVIAFMEEACGNFIAPGGSYSE